MHTSDVHPATLPPPLRNIYLHWQGLTRGGLLPRLSDMQVHDMVGQWHSLALAEVVRDHDRQVIDFRILYISAQLRTNSTAHLIGKCFRELPGKGPESHIWAGYFECATLGVPLRASFPYMGPNPEYDRTRDVLLPLADSDDGLGFILAGVLFLPAEPAERV